MNTRDKVHSLQGQADHMARAILAMNARITELERMKRPLLARIWHNLTQWIKL